MRASDILNAKTSPGYIGSIVGNGSINTGTMTCDAEICINCSLGVTGSNTGIINVNTQPVAVFVGGTDTSGRTQTVHFFLARGQAATISANANASAIVSARAINSFT